MATAHPTKKGAVPCAFFQLQPANRLNTGPFPCPEKAFSLPRSLLPRPAERRQRSSSNVLPLPLDKRALLDLQVNMLAEQESTATLKMLEKICTHLGIEYEAEEEQQLAKATDVDVIAKELDEKLTSAN